MRPLLGLVVADLDDDGRLERLRRLARLMDSAYELPFVGVKVGLDPLLGLFPAAGDVVAGAVAAWIVVEARRLGAPWKLVGRMAGNVALDLLTGTVPVIGDIFDVLYRANRRNVALLEKHLADREG